MQVKLLDIFKVFVRVGCLIFGGGAVIIPLLEEEAVKKRNWLTSEELVEFYAISQVIPGINIPDVSMFIGYKLRGKTGAVVAGFGIILVPVVIILCLAAVLSQISANPFVKSALWGAGIGTIVVISSAVRTIWKHSIVDKFTLALFILVLLLMLTTKISPVWIVFVSLFLGVAKGFLVEDCEDNNA